MTQSNLTALQTVLNYISDSREGYQKAAETVEHGAFKRIFTARAQERANMAARIEGMLRERGEIDESNGTAIGAFHRSLMSVAALVQSDEKAAIETIDDGEERLRTKVRDTIESGDLTVTDRTMLLGIERELKADARIIESMEEYAG